jgi:hypothetical protein
MLADAISPFRAEWCKIAGNRLVTLSLMWIFPLAAVVAVLLMFILALVSDEARLILRTGAAVLEVWPHIVPALWNLPHSWLGRLLLVGFAAFVFAGEYQWRTWKNIIPRSRRVALVLNKFVVVVAFVLVAFLSAMIVLSLGAIVAVRLAGGTLAGIRGGLLADMAGEYALGATLAVVSTLIASGYAALAGMCTRSILGGVLVALGATMGEQFSIVGLSQIADWLDAPRLLGLYRLTPSYNLGNAASWIRDGVPLPILIPFPLAVDSLAFSAAVLAGWVLGLIALTAIVFQRQDIAT